jgi:hypothetical protein
MNATKNNFDQSSTGHDIEVTVMLDCYMSRIHFDENFHLYSHSGYSSTCRAWFTDCGQADTPDSVADCIDWKAATAEDCKGWLIERYCTGKYGESIDWLESMAAEYYGEEYPDWHEAARDTMNGGNAFQYDEGVSLEDAIGNDFAEVNQYFTIKYNVAKIRGYCQGDYAEVLYDPATWADGFDPREYFQNLFYDAPVYARVTVDGEEYYIDELLKDNYQWDRDEAEKIVRGFDLPESVINWIVSELPVDAPYVN